MAQRSSQPNKKLKLSSGQKSGNKPLLSVRNPPKFSTFTGKNVPEKRKPPSSSTQPVDDADSARASELWVDQFAPSSEAELAVHKRKVEDVRTWFHEAFGVGPSEKLRKYRRILVLTGPAGSGKTATVRVLARELGFEISEWVNSVEDVYSDGDFERESLMHRFEGFMTRASQCTTLSLSSAKPGPSKETMDRKRVIVLEDLPNILHQPTQAAFHSILKTFLEYPPDVPLVIILSEVSAKGMTRDERIGENGDLSMNREEISIRTVLPPSISNSPFVRQIAFNPIAPTLMQRALQALMKKVASSRSSSKKSFLSKEELDLIIETASGDIRSALMTLQFLSMNIIPGLPKHKNTRALLEAETRKEQSLNLFHMIGKVLTNKRKGDPPGASQTAREKHRDQELDSRLKIPRDLPPWLSDHERKPSRVDIEDLYASSPIDTGLFALYIHQNYTQYCENLSECEVLNDWLSYVDCSGGEKWYQTNPYQFHLLTLGTLHALPCPGVRHRQKSWKPVFFGALSDERLAEDAISDAQVWLHGLTGTQWPKLNIALEMSTILRTKANAGYILPHSYRAFTSKVFSPQNYSGVEVLEDGSTTYGPEDDENIPGPGVIGDKDEDEPLGRWLSDDEIEDSEWRR